MTNRTWTGQMKQGFNNPWGDLNGFGSGGEIDFSSSERLVDQTAANIEEYKRLIRLEKNILQNSQNIENGLQLVLKKVVIDKHFNVSQQEVDARYNQYFNRLSTSTDSTLEKDLDHICKLNY